MSSNRKMSRDDGGDSRCWIRSSAKIVHDIGCTMCSKVILDGSEAVLLKPCGCNVCHRCLLNADAQELTCKACNIKVLGHQFVLIGDPPPEDLRSSGSLSR